MSINRLLYDSTLMNGILNYVENNIDISNNIINTDGNLDISYNGINTIIDLSSNIQVEKITISDNDNNILIGTNQFIGNHIGEFNLGIGQYCLAQEIFGDGNIGVGNYSLSEMINGNNNLAFGRYAMYFNINGNSNIAIGNNAFFQDLIGNYNIAIGFTAGRKNPIYGYNTFDNCICLGNFSQVNNNNSGILKFSPIENIQYPPSNSFWFGDPDNGFIDVSLNNLNCNNITFNKLNNSFTLERNNAQKTTTDTVSYLNLVNNTFTNQITYTNNNTTGDNILINVKGVYSITAIVYSETTPNPFIMWIDKNGTNTTTGTLLYNQHYQISSTHYSTANWTGILNVGDYVRIKTNMLTSNIAVTDTNLYFTLLYPC